MGITNFNAMVFFICWYSSHEGHTRESKHNEISLYTLKVVKNVLLYVLKSGANRHFNTVYAYREN